MNKNFVVDKEKCTGCGLCVKDCSTVAIKLDENNNPYMTEKGNTNCMECQHCLAICPTGAISILGRNPEGSSSIEDFSPENILNTIKTRKSCRHFKLFNTQTLL